jgi:hypothetical protein
MSATPQQPDATDSVSERTEPGLPTLRGEADQLYAYTAVPGGSYLRLVGNQTESGWNETVEIGEPGNWQAIETGDGAFGPTAKYNQLVDDIGSDEVDDE